MCPCLGCPVPTGLGSPLIEYRIVMLWCAESAWPPFSWIIQGYAPCGALFERRRQDGTQRPYGAFAAGWPLWLENRAAARLLQRICADQIPRHRRDRVAEGIGRRARHR